MSIDVYAGLTQVSPSLAFAYQRFTGSPTALGVGLRLLQLGLGHGGQGVLPASAMPGRH